MNRPSETPPAAEKPHLETNVTLPASRKPLLPKEEIEDPGLLNLNPAELKYRNLAIRERVEAGENIGEEIIEILRREEGVTEVAVYFCDMEGSLRTLGVDREHMIQAMDNLTFDGSSVGGFTVLDKSDLRFSVDWDSFRWLPAQEFGAGKVMVFANVADKDGNPYEGDFRGRLSREVEGLREKGMKMNLAPEIEGFIFKGKNAEKLFGINNMFEPASLGGYFSALPQDTLKQFTDRLAKVTRSLGFRNEKDHPEVAPGQFELNYRFRGILGAADQILLYKQVARQIADEMGLTASFLPKPIAGINGNGMHSNISIQEIEGGKNIFFDAKGEMQLSETARLFIAGVLNRGEEICLAINPSVNAYRRLDPNYEAPNEIKMSDSDRGSMVRVPIGNENSARMEVRTVAPDVNPYLAYTLIMAAGMEGVEAGKETREEIMKLLESDRKIDKLPGTIQDAIEAFEDSEFVTRVMGDENKSKYVALKQEVADRSPKSLGTRVKKWEVLDHHEVRNQELSNEF